MTKQVRDFKEFERIRIIVILNKKCEHVATVQSISRPYPGSCHVDVWSRPGQKHLELTHQGKAGGGGYDRYTAALRGAEVEGIRLYDHCSPAGSFSEKDAKSYIKLLKLQKSGADHAALAEAADKLGFRWANGYTSLYAESGLSRLSQLGFRVIEAA